MSAADRWSRIEELFSALFEMPVEDRRRALEAVEDADLRAEVGALLTTHEQLTDGNGDFLAGLDSAPAGALLEEAGRPEDPATIGRYRVVRRLARGGMGIVYQAHDPRLDRSVAIKLLPPYLNADPGSVRRLGDEARAASALDHTHIETVYEIGETADERVFIAMAYYEGETLRERSRRGPMPVAEVIDLGAQLAEGLSAAHRNGIIHRDIKPENLLVTKGGVLKIVDFGVAKVMREGVASAGLPLGTAAYMSPEQTRGEALDHRTDIWSTGVVLYEMLASERPFGEGGEALIHSIRNDSPQPLSAFRKDVPASVATTVERCLEKNREDRFNSADALARALFEAQQGGPEAMAAARGSAAAHRPNHRQRTWIAATLGVAALALVGFLMRSDGPVGTSASVEVSAPGIAVLPFEIRGEGLDIWREGMVDLLSINLEGTAELRGIDSRTVIARWREAEEAGAPDLARALDVARRTGAQYAVIGNVVASGSNLRIGAQVYSLEDGKSLSSVVVEGSPDSLFALVDRLSIGVLAAAWQGEERPHQEVDLSRITTTSLPALKYFLEGETLLRRADFDGATAAYERAIAGDSTFAFAHFHLGLAAGWIGDELRHNQAYQRALRHAGRLPEREALLLRAMVAAPARAIPDEFAQLLEITRKYPDDADAWYYLGDRYWHSGEQVLAGQEESEKAFRKVVELDPGYAAAYIHLVNNAFVHRPDSGRAARLIYEYHRLAPNGTFDQENRIAFGLAFGDPIRRAQALAALDTLPIGALSWLADGYLDHPRFRATQLLVLERRELPEIPPGPQMRAYLFDNSMSQGRLRAARIGLESPLLSRGFRALALYTIHSLGLPAQGVDLDQALTLTRTDYQPLDAPFGREWFYPGAYAADQARWEDHAAAVSGLRADGYRLLAEGDSSTARFLSGAALALEGQGLWRRGDAERALQLLVAGQRQATWGESFSREALNETIRWWIGELLLEMDRPREAATYFAASWHNPWAAERLGPIYERIGDPAQAREAYALVAAAWRDADPEVQPRARSARAAVERLDRVLED